MMGVHSTGPVINAWYRRTRRREGVVGDVLVKVTLLGARQQI